MRAVLPAARSSSPVRSVVGRFRAVGGVKSDSTLDAAEEMDWQSMNVINGGVSNGSILTETSDDGSAFFMGATTALVFGFFDRNRLKSFLNCSSSSSSSSSSLSSSSSSSSSRICIAAIFLRAAAACPRTVLRRSTASIGVAAVEISVTVIVENAGELVLFVVRRASGVEISSMAERLGTLPVPPTVMREAVSPGFGVLVLGMSTSLSTFGVEETTGARARDGVMSDSDRNDALRSVSERGQYLLTAARRPVFFFALVIVLVDDNDGDWGLSLPGSKRRG